jgi:hypothetical protein
MGKISRYLKKGRWKGGGCIHGFHHGIFGGRGFGVGNK